MNDGEYPSFRFSEKVHNFGPLIGILEGNGFYLRRMLIQYSVTGFALALPIYGLSYLTANPKASCRQADGSILTSLLLEACSRPDQCTFNYEFDSWTKQFALVCDREALKDFSISLMFWITAVGSLIVSFWIVSFWIDCLGTRKEIMLGSLAYLIFSLLALVSDTFTLKLAFIGLMTSFNTNIINASSILVKEVTRESSVYNAVVMNYGFVFYSLGPLFRGLLTLFIKSATTLWQVSTLVFFVSMTGNFFFFVESPLWLYRKKGLLL